jgi:hypothetical protein
VITPHVVPNLKDKLPKINFYLIEDQTHRVVENLNLGKLDLAMLATSHTKVVREFRVLKQLQKSLKTL